MMQSIDSLTPDKHAVRRAFGVAAARYDRHADLQRWVGLALLEKLTSRVGPARWVVDLGSGTGFFLPFLRQRFPDAVLVAVDFAEEMLRTGRLHTPDAGFLCGDAEFLPLASETADVVYSNLAVQWCSNLGRAVAEMARVLRPGGTAAFTLFGPATLDELRRAWRAVDDYPRVGAFVQPDDVRAALSLAGLEGLLVDDEQRPTAYATVHDLMRDLKGLGAHNAARGRPRHLTGKAAFARMAAAYQAQMQGGPILATYQVISVVARKP